jgi:purine nucleosidase
MQKLKYNKMKNYTLDTDIGTDVDDVFALVYLLKNPKANVKAITTVMGNTEIRAKITRKIERILQADVHIIIGKSGPKEAVKKYWTGIEEKALSQEELKEPIKKLKFPVYDNDSRLICIGPLTNIAYQIKHNPSIKSVKKLYIMGSREDSHNFKADKKAKEIVFNQPWDIYMITKEDSDKIAFSREELEHFKGTKLGDFIYDSAIGWLDYSGKEKSCMYDVLTVSAALGEQYVKFKKLSSNRFISYDTNIKLKDSLIDAIRSLT